MKNAANSPALSGIRWLAIVLVATTGAVAALVFYQLTLSPDRLEKLELELERIGSRTATDDETLCEQYALVARKNGWYPCLRCDGSDSIYLYRNEVWKYGKTCGGEAGQYPASLPAENLRYEVEFAGNKSDCLKEEKRKIYNYPNLPECRKRSFVLLRPPENRIDR